MDPVALHVLRRVGALAGLAPLAVLFEDYQPAAFDVRGQRGEAGEIGLNRGGPAAGPAVLEVDADQFPQHDCVFGVVGLQQLERLQSPLRRAAEPVELLDGFVNCAWCLT